MLTGPLLPFSAPDITPSLNCRVPITELRRAAPPMLLSRGHTMSHDYEKINATTAPSPAGPSYARLRYLLFLLLWLVYGVAINSANLNAFGLQQAGVEAYVERHTLYLEGSRHPRLQVQPVVDAFLYRGHIYPAKQPGQFMAGAGAYFPLYALGLSYTRDYLLTAALVTFLTASLATAAAAAAVFDAARELAPEGAGLFWPLVAALSYGLGTTAFAYSGIAWHDSLATGYLTVAFCLLVKLARGRERRPNALAAAAGGLLGLTVTTSMLPFFMAAVAALYFLSLRRWMLAPWFFLGGCVGLAPLLVYNAVCFGNPLLLPNVAGNYSDTFFSPSWANFLSKLDFYARMLTLYAPVCWAGLLGLALLPRRLRREQLAIAGMLLALAAYILNIEANGTCQYGPRYLLPAMPFVCLGLAGFSRLRVNALRKVAAVAAAACALTSFFINLVGAAHGAMLCDFGPHSALGVYLFEMWHGGMRSYPLAPWLVLPLCLCSALLAYTLFTRKQLHRR